MNVIKKFKSKINIKPYSPSLGATVKGIDLSKKLSNTELSVVKKAFTKYQVLFFQEQSEISPEVQIELGKSFGPLHYHPAAPRMKGFPEIFEIHTHKNSKVSDGSENFHSDVSCDEEPPLGTMLQLHILPDCGGDTLFTNMYMAYESLSEKMKNTTEKAILSLKKCHVDIKIKELQKLITEGFSESSVLNQLSELTKVKTQISKSLGRNVG